ncbi:MAG: tricarballylate utilization 4Fe-4S protein TcuB [bacterium]
MPSTDLVKEAERTMVICNACRYCEGYCAVFPAMELRKTFSGPDLKYLTNLCHNCRDCYYACQYAPPHELDVNVPKTFAELRLETYREFAWPDFLAGLFRRNGFSVSLITAISVAIVFLLALVFQGVSGVFSVHLGENAFYKVIPYLLIVLPISALGLYVLIALMIGVVRFWCETGGRLSELADARAHVQAIWDALRLKYLDGGGGGCNYPDDRFSMIRKWFHHLVFYGFMLCLASTTVAAIYHHFLKWVAPYPFWSWPVALGTIGGTALLIGTGGLLYFKGRMDDAPATPRAFTMDVGFLVLLFLTSLTGLLLLVLRDTPAMGTLFAVHLGVVVGLFITLPYGKFVHAVYRYAALVRNAIEQASEKR